MTVTSVQSVDLTILAPAIVTAVGAIVVLLADISRGKRGQDLPAPWLPWVTVGILITAAASMWPTAGTPWSPTDGVRTFCSGVGELQTCSYVVDQRTLVLQWVVLLATALVAALGAREVTRRSLATGEYHFLLLSSVTGAVVLLAARDLPTAVVALETVTLPAVALAALGRDRRSSQGALSLYLSSATASAVTLYGAALLYTATGTLDYGRMAVALADPATRSPIAVLGAVLVLGAFIFKLAAVPFHAWAPDAYAGAPLPVAAYLSVVSKTAGLGGLVVLLLVGLLPLASTWASVLAVVVMATMVVGNTVALRQTSVIRLLAWSSVAQVGYVLLPLAALAWTADIRLAIDALSASLSYLVLYAVMTAGAWAVIAVVMDRVRPPDGVLLVSHMRGLARTSPALGITMLLIMAALAGVPPAIAGLVVKVRVLQVAVAAGAWPLVAVAVAATVVGLAYYLRVAAAIVSPPETEEDTSLRRGWAAGAGLVAAVTAGIILVWSALPDLLLRLVS